MNENVKAGDVAINAALFLEGRAAATLTKALTHLAPLRGVAVMSGDAGFFKYGGSQLHISPEELQLHEQNSKPETVVSTLLDLLAPLGASPLLIVDMRSTMLGEGGRRNIEFWSAICDALSTQDEVGVLSVYARDYLINTHAPTALRSHPQFLAPSGIYKNPLYVPSALLEAPKGAQLSHILASIVPDFRGVSFFAGDDEFAVMGTDPKWVTSEPQVNMTAPSQQRWQIYCLGPLRVYQARGERIKWNIKGSAPKKTRALFAYLLTHGEKGAHGEKIAELLWPTGAAEETKRARLHHTVATLRKTLGSGESVVRAGDYYRLNPPEGSWTDIAEFEQLCRRGVSLFKRGQTDEAYQIYTAAEALYAGDLFEDISQAYTDSDSEDWCLARRTWLREVALKLQRDFSALLRGRGQLSEALIHSERALKLDPASEEANIEIMQVFHAQGRSETIARQYRQYKVAMQALGATPEGTAVHATFLALTRR